VRTELTNRKAMVENADMINIPPVCEERRHNRLRLKPLLAAAALFLAFGTQVATAQTDRPVVPGRDALQPSDENAAPRPLRIPPVYHGPDGHGSPTTGQKLWKKTGTDLEAQALLFRMRDSNDPEARARALEMLPLDQAKSSDLERLFWAAQDLTPAVQQAAWTSLDHYPQKELFAYAIRTLAWGAEERVRPLDAALPKLGPRLEKMMTATLETELEAPRHRRAAAYCLGRSGTESAVSLLSKYAQAGQGDLAQTCAVALSMLRSPVALHDWEAMLAHQDPVIQTIAVRALADLNSPPARQAVFETAAGKRSAGRMAEQEAARRIADWPDEDAIPALIDIMRQNTPLNALVAKLLREKTGQNFGTSPEPWDRWLQEGGQKRNQAQVEPLPE